MSLNSLPFLTKPPPFLFLPFPISFSLLSGRKVNRSVFYIPYNKLCPLILQVFKEERYLNDAYQCADVIWQYGLLKKGYGLCHGTAGNAYAFLSLYSLTQDAKYLYRACKVGFRTAKQHTFAQEVIEMALVNLI